jgi:hypothetical protein
MGHQSILKQQCWLQAFIWNIRAHLLLLMTKCSSYRNSDIIRTTLKRFGQWSECKESIDKALNCVPGTRDAHNNIVNILQYTLLSIQYIAILVYANTIYWYCDLNQYNILYCQDIQYNILYCHDKPIQYIVLSGQSNTIYC